MKEVYNDRHDSRDKQIGEVATIVLYGGSIGGAVGLIQNMYEAGVMLNSPMWGVRQIVLCLLVVVGFIIVDTDGDTARQLKGLMLA